MISIPVLIVLLIGFTVINFIILGLILDFEAMIKKGKKCKEVIWSWRFPKEE